ncbi:MAG TPA: response regulator [Rhodothermales bacterium]|jgi:CheY-like chemotaxis protein
MESPSETVTVLAVDDDFVCHMLVERAMRDIRSCVRIAVAHHGLEALEKLRCTDPTNAVRPPYVILLDLRMPQMDGLEFLEAVRTDQKLHDAIVFVLSTSTQEEDVRTAFSFNVAGYFVKSADYAEFREMMTVLDQYCRLTAFPPRSDRAKHSPTAAGTGG